MCKQSCSRELVNFALAVDCTFVFLLARGSNHLAATGLNMFAPYAMSRMMMLFVLNRRRRELSYTRSILAPILHYELELDQEIIDSHRK